MASNPNFIPRHFSAAQIETWWIEQARISPYFFIWYLTELKPARHHEIWIREMLNPDTLRLNIVGPRESAKTQISVYVLAWMLAKRPHDTFGIIAVSDTVAVKRLTMLKSIFQENLRFKNVFPWIHVDTQRSITQHDFSIWSERAGNGARINYPTWRSIIARQSPHLLRDPSIYAAGQGGQGVIGGRISGVLLLDDLVDDKYLSVEAQDKIMNYINTTLEPTIMEQGRIWNIGTRWMLDDIYERLEKSPEWRTITIPALLYDADGTAFSYWPQFWPLHKLEKKRLTMNDDLTFRIMYLCDPTAITASLFSREALHVDLPPVLPAFAQVFVSTDLATSLKTRADWSVAYIIGIDRDQNVYILDGVRYKEEGINSLDRIAKLAEATFFTYGRFDGILVENVAFQAFFSQTFRQMYPALQVEDVVPKGDKMHRAKQVSIWTMKKKLFINQRIFFIEELRKEWFNFPMHKHDDTLDPIGLLFQHLNFGNLQATLIRVKPPDPFDVKATVHNLSRLRRA